MNSEIRRILEQVKEGTMDVDEALLQIKEEPFKDIGYAKVDLHRKGLVDYTGSGTAPAAPAAPSAPCVEYTTCASA